MAMIARQAMSRARRIRLAALLLTAFASVFAAPHVSGQNSPSVAERGRSGAGESLLPAGSSGPLRPADPWDHYKFYIAGTATVVGLQSLVIVALLFRHARRRRVESTLLESEARFRRMADDAPVMVWTAGTDMQTDFFNKTVLEFTGLSLPQLLGEGWLARIHPDDLDESVRTYVPAFNARQPFQMEFRFRRADGTYRWMLDIGVPRYAPDSGFAGYIGTALDITERREMEQSLRDNEMALRRSYEHNQDLAGRLIHAQEAERARIARDLHDDVSQQLAGLSIAFSSLKHQMGDLQVSEDVQSAVRALHQRTTTLAQNVRHLSHDLHPTVLRHAGLVAALTSYCAELERTHGIVMTCTAEGDVAAIAPDTALCLYRIAQEALRNVIAHANAGRGDIRLVHTDEQTAITILDDGRGFDVARTIEHGKGLGLVSITERVRLAGGSVSIVADLNRGTRVCAHIPTLAAVTANAATDIAKPQYSLS